MTQGTAGRKQKKEAGWRRHLKAQADSGMSISASAPICRTFESVCIRKLRLRSIGASKWRRRILQSPERLWRQAAGTCMSKADHGSRRMHFQTAPFTAFSDCG